MTQENNIDKGQQLFTLINESADHPLVIIFSAHWHSHSDIVEIIAEKLMEADTDLNLISLDSDADEELFDRYNISAIPSAIIIKDKKMIKKVEGTFSKKLILDILKVS